MWGWMRGGRVVIIGGSPLHVRLSCEACGAHTVVDRGSLASSVLCATCGVTRQVVDRRHAHVERDPDRRVMPVL